MTIKIFEVDSVLNDEAEIGMASSFKLTTNRGIAPLLNIQDTHLQPLVGYSDEIYIKLYGHKTPVPPKLPFADANGPDAFFIARSTLRRPQTDTDNRDLVISALIHMLGGEVTIQPHEIVAAARRNLHLYQQVDPYLIIVKSEDT